MSVWICLDLDKDIVRETVKVLNDFKPDFDILNWKVDSESVMTVDIKVKNLEELLYLPFILDDDIVIYGTDSDIIMTKRDMRELGLG